MMLTARIPFAWLVAIALAAPLALFTSGVADAAPRHHARSHAAPSYPMKAEDYQAMMEKRIDGVRAAIDKKLDRRGVSADRKKAIHKVFDESSKELRAEIARATADGTVTQAEADKVKPLAVGLRAKVRERLRAEKDPAAKEKLVKDEAARAEASKHAGKHDKEKHDKAKHDPAEAGSKVAKSEHAKSEHASATKAGMTKPTKAKSDKKKSGGPTKQAKTPPGASAKKHDKHKTPPPDTGADL